MSRRMCGRLLLRQRAGRLAGLGLLVPAFGLPSDARAADLLADVFHGRAIRLVLARVLAAAGVTLTALALPHPARLLERDRAAALSAWSQPTPDAEALLQY